MRATGVTRTPIFQGFDRRRAGKETQAMPTVIEKPTRVTAAGNRPKLIDEYVGRVNTGEGGVSIANMRSPAGWAEPGQTPDFDEYTVVLKGTLRVEHRGGVLDVRAGQAVLVRRGEWVRYSTPGEEGAEYVAVCLPAFSPETVHRDRA
jgi:mannose-6-phosphate isomerase-like protein (cupin superfamily)